MGTFIACLAMSACADCAPGYSEREAREDRGPQLAGDVYWSAAMTFGADGTEVFYAAEPGSGAAAVLRAARVTGGAQRDVDAARMVGGLFPAADGTALYEIEYVPEGEPGPSAYRLREAFSGVNPLADAPPDLTRLLAVSPSGRRLLGIAGAEGPVVVDLDTGERTAMVCDVEPATFSPRSDAVLCSGGLGNVTAVPLEGQALPALATVPDAGRVHAMSWTDERILAVFGGSTIGKMIVADPASGEIVARLSAGDHTTIESPMAFTSDGKALAFVETECLETHGWYGCTDRAELRIRMLDLATGEARTIASAGWKWPEDGPFLSVGLALSPDGKTIAYAFGSGLHVRPTGR